MWGYDPWGLEREGIPVGAENRPVAWSKWPNLMNEEMKKNWFLLTKRFLSTLILKFFLRKSSVSSALTPCVVKVLAVYIYSTGHFP